ncbi:MAG: BMP family protein [Chloroflexi bacterium]|nr:BMP family protein [Chloroflexota bacterium]MCL5076130.1 BMP family protein [Chloroflexota bacterium]
MTFPLRHKKVFVGLVTILMLGLVLSACTPAATPTPTKAAAPGSNIKTAVTPNPAPVKKPIKVALILTGPTTDLSWNGQAYEALKELKQKLGVEIAYSESISDADVERVLREYANSGYNLIIAHSFGYGDATFKVAKDYPKTAFAWAGGINKTAPNVADYDQPFYQAYYLVGILAGYMSKTGKIGAISGFDIPVCHAEAKAFEAGAKSVNPKAQLFDNYVGEWVDPSKPREVALGMIENGVDFFIGCGEGPIIGAIKAAQQKGALAVGYVGDQYSIAPNTVVTSMIWDLYTLFAQMTKDVEEGNFKGEYYSYGVAQGALKLAPFRNFEDKVPEAAKKKIEEVRQQIVSGKFEVPYIPK